LARDTATLTWEITTFLSDCMTHFDPHYQRYLSQYEGYSIPLSQIDPEKFLATLSTVNTLLGGPLGSVSPEVFMKEMQPIADKMSQLTAEQMGYIVGTLLAPAVYGKAIKEAAALSRLAKVHPEVAAALEGLKGRLGTAKGFAEINPTSTAILKNGYYEVNGIKFSEFYYNRLWEGGRQAPSLIAKSILEHAIEIVPDPKGYAGFYKYVSDGWYMIYNPSTKIVAHLEPLK